MQKSPRSLSDMNPTLKIATMGVGTVESFARASGFVALTLQGSSESHFGTALPPLVLATILEAALSWRIKGAAEQALQFMDQDFMQAELRAMHSESER
ncbi:MAG: hypothetical protein ACI9F9_001283 [Candidatus Paceibacteria bacterium]|jgi:hypothetical protein